MTSQFHKFLKSGLKAAESNAKVLFGSGEMKQVFIVRTDLEMGKGKIAAQCCHAAVQAYRDLLERGPESKKALDKWEWQGSRKVVLKVNSEEELRDIIKKAKTSSLYASTIRDAGRTQIAAGSTTVGVLGPADEKLIDQVSGHLKLL